MATPQAILKQIQERKSQDPHAFLGIHPVDADKKVIRLWRPGAKTVSLEVKGKMVEAFQVDPSGLFEYITLPTVTSNDYRVYHPNGMIAHDPYSMSPSFGELDRHYFAKGVHYETYNALGGRLTTHQGCKGTKFTVWAPHASSVSLVGDFNYWDGRINLMRQLADSGVWELFVPGLGEREKYKFEIHSKDGSMRVKSDPYAYYSELRPGNASITFDLDGYTWNDADWIEKREKTKHTKRPINIYEVHLGSWKRPDGQFLNYRDLAHQLVEYCQEMHFSHVELMPLNEHPLDESWGYQVSGYYSATSRFGTPKDFQYFVDIMHQNNLGVIIDWVPAHFPTDAFSLAQFDGTYLYEYKDPRKGFHPHWNTYIFNFGLPQVSNFLLGSALFWLEKMHVDGIRVDAVASMLFLDFGRKEGEWIPNKHGGRENLEAIEFLKHFNSIVHEHFPGVMTFAEESHWFPKVTHSLNRGGLGFDYKWDLGWMNETLTFLQTDHPFRAHKYKQLTESMGYAFGEKYTLVLSHDEVVHEKRSVFSKMPGTPEEQFSNVRLLYSYQLCHPGKNIIFMGAELGQKTEWNCVKELPWEVLQEPMNQKLWQFFKGMNACYQNTPALWEADYEENHFQWINHTDEQRCVISYLRKGAHSQVICIHNFLPQAHLDYHIPLPHVKQAKEIFNTDAEAFGGQNTETALTLKQDGFAVTLPPLATLIVEVMF